VDATGTPRTAVLMGRLREDASANWPVAGDWVLLSPEAGTDAPRIERVLPRRTVLARRDAGRGMRPQPLAANVDVAFIVTSLNGDLNPRRIERFLTLVRSAGVAPVVLLSKVDLATDGHALETALARLREVCGETPLLPLSVFDGQGLAALTPWLRRGETVVLLGASGVGKSTLLNHLLGHAQQAVRDVRRGDDRGRHATTTRQLFPLPGGALLLDTPGVRALEPWAGEAALDTVFADVDTLAMDCRFRDCGHGDEPGCAVQAALTAGTLTPERLSAYGKLRREQHYQARQADPALARQHETQRKRMMSTFRKQYKRHPKGRQEH
jgi:ribosome biogenesis GTPase